ncbi:MAG: LPS assembly protein LptD, partial [Pseudohongiella sp.]|nr:LPS assembly protein LptD [Pseudohongiella sp.]
AGNPERGVSVFSLDSGLIFDRPVTVAGLSATQTLEPRLYYLFSEQKEQHLLPNFDSAQLHMNFNQLFRDNRFSGGDRVGDANQISAAVTSRLLTIDGQERARISVGQIFHFKDRKVSLDSPLQKWLTLQPLDTDRSALIMEASYRPHERWQLMTDLQWDQENNNIDQGSIAVQLRGDQDRLFNLAFRYREKTDVFLDAPPLLDPRIKQTDISAVWPLNESWRMLGRWNYDHSNSRNLETFAGVEYSNCCATVRLIARDWVNDYEFNELNTRQNRGIFFQLSLHGLGDLAGGGLDSLLSNSIPGFKEQDSND